MKKLIIIVAAVVACGSQTTAPEMEPADSPESAVQAVYRSTIEREIARAADVPPHACQPGLAGVCFTCAKNKSRRARRDSTRVYVSPMPISPTGIFKITD
jgi:hypothetical protein